MTQNNLSHRIYEDITVLASHRGLRIENQDTIEGREQTLKKQQLFSDCLDMCDTHTTQTDKQFLLDVFKLLHNCHCYETLDSYQKPDKLQTLFNFEQEEEIIV